MKMFFHCNKLLTKYSLYPCKHKFFLSKFSLQRGIHTDKMLFSQPTLLSHPHLLKENEITPGICAATYKDRRQKFMNELNKSSFYRKEDCAQLVVIPSATVVYMSDHIPYTFRQNTDFLYLCGYKEPDSILVLNRTSSQNEHECCLFVPKQSEHSIRWEGSKMNPQRVTEFLGISQTLYKTDFEKYLQSFVESHKQLVLWYDYTNKPFSPVHDQMKNFMESFRGSIHFADSPIAAVQRIRLFKSNEEVELMRKSCRIASEAFREAMKFSHANIAEAHLQAKIDYECRIRGADYLAYPPVVAGGDRANTIHYIDNNNVVRDCDMVLVDAGCEYHGYASDITRTWPVNGKFTDPQKELYELLLELQEELIVMCLADRTLDELFEIMCLKLGKGLQSLGIISPSLSDKNLASAAYEVCPHHLGHYLGMDIHDTHLISRNTKLGPGMIVTIEPGVYISKNNEKCPEKYRGLCIRIEDDVLITEEGNEVLTASCPKTVVEIEELVGRDQISFRNC